MPSTPPGLRALWISASQASSFPLLTMPCISREARCRSEEHTSELHHDQISYAVFCLKKKKTENEQVALGIAADERLEKRDDHATHERAQQRPDPADERHHDGLGRDFQPEQLGRHETAH